jgi:hypothetical protein
MMDRTTGIQFEDEVIRLRNRIIDEIFFAMGLGRASRLRKVFGTLFNRPAGHFARIVAKYQAMVPEFGFGATAEKALPDFNASVKIQGIDGVPLTGPLVLASNHIGGVDTLSVASCVQRKDLKIMVSDVGFLRAMSIANDYFIFVPTDSAGRMAALHQAIDHLEHGGAVLVFAHSEVEPDPDLIDGAYEAIGDWSPSLEIMLRKVPSTRLVISIISGVVDKRFMRHPLVRLRKTFFQRQKLAEFLQIITTMINPSRVETRARISLSKALTIDDLGEEFRLMPGIILAARKLLREHLE